MHAFVFDLQKARWFEEFLKRLINCLTIMNELVLVARQNPVKSDDIAQAGGHLFKRVFVDK
jgi:hypothetical protein